MECKGVTSTLIVMILTLPCFMSFVSAGTTFLGRYEVTVYSFEPPSSAEYTQTHTSGGSVQTHYGIYTNTSLYISSDIEFTGSFEGYSESWKYEDRKQYCDANKRPILYTVKIVAKKLNENVESWSALWEYGNYIGNYPNRDDIIKADIGDQWTYTYEQRYYEDGKYEETHMIKVEITVKDFPTKIVEAGIFSTARFDEIEWEDGVLDSNKIIWRRLSDGKTVAHEWYQWENGEQHLSTKQELISEKETGGLSSIPLIAIAGTAVVVIIIVSFLTYKFLKRRKKVKGKESQRKRPVVPVSSRSLPPYPPERPAGKEEEEPLRILKVRLVKGEITKEEYEKMKRELGYSEP